MTATTRGLTLAAGAAALGLGVVGVRQQRKLAPVPRELRSPLTWMPMSIDNRFALPVVRRMLAEVTPVARGVELIADEVGATAEHPSVPVFVYRPEGESPAGGRGALLWIHGGGTVAGIAEKEHGFCSQVARDLGVVVVNVDYRLAPEHPFPAPMEDCHAALTWLHDQIETLGIDPSRVAVGGASAGGLLAAAVAHRALDGGRLPLAFQLLVYPMLDDRTVLRSDDRGRGELVWTPRANRFAWESYLGHPIGLVEDRPYAVPARRAELAGLPPAWIGVGELDLFHEEDVEYAARLRAAGVECELHIEPGMPHAVDVELYGKVASMTAFRQRMIDALAAGLRL